MAIEYISTSKITESKEFHIFKESNRAFKIALLISYSTLYTYQPSLGLDYRSSASWISMETDTK